MITIKPIPADAVVRVRDSAGQPGWLHNCGAFVYAPNQPHRCGVCWSACRTGWAYNGHWQPAYTTRQEAAS
ncbi:hypothetical protein HPO96_28600 [Kribbella sandramycini]|uniref:Uncharacterized protein n=1 Tax=Kribbella sandramycini TaxID=60450 RepID=A0A7Y4L4F9_9ACTN|nr:hypothetical protein [Kribbella sandramycini]MBB6571568.1 hypothetical protein [Kribbella sandramycini]NOL44214.1 hypothetical protein [Kribbella sandramycini]